MLTWQAERGEEEASQMGVDVKRKWKFFQIY